MNGKAETLPAASSEMLSDLQRINHRQCVMCGKTHNNGFGLDFTLQPDGAVEATIFCSDHLAGYEKMLHGGVICSLLDSAMTNCLFSHGYVAVTAKLDVRFRHPARTGRPATIRAWLPDPVECGPIYETMAVIEQDGLTVADAKGVFVKKERGMPD